MRVKIKFFNKLNCSLLLLALFFLAAPVLAQAFYKDLSISSEDVRFEENVLRGKKVRLYVTVHNNSHFDLSGVVKFYNEKTSSFIGPDQPVSILAQKTDDVFIDWPAELVGVHPIAIRVVPWDAEGDDPLNNKLTKNLTVDIDSDGDGVSNSFDSDDDNDGIQDVNDAFPFDPSESKDTDGDGIGNNKDADDDGDFVLDAEDAFPLDPNEVKDTDNDGTGDSSDSFPYDAGEWLDSDGDGIGDNEDTDDQNHGPIPFIQMSETKVQVGKGLTFNALKSKDPDGQVTDYEWDFGDGIVETGVIVEHVFESPGEHIVTLKVTDNQGESREQQVQIKVGLSWWLIPLIILAALALIAFLGLFIPGSRFHHKKMKIKWK